MPKVLLLNIASLLSIFAAVAFAAAAPLDLARGAGDIGADIAGQLGAAGGPNGAGTQVVQDPRLIVARLVKIALGFIATILLILMLYAGFLWMTAGGNDEQITSAKGYIRNAALGIIIILASYSITIAILNLTRGVPLQYGTSGWIY